MVRRDKCGSVWAESFEGMQLANGVKALLCHDPSQKSVARIAVAVNAGTTHEKSPGLAHWLEHLLFLGSKAYPREGGLDAYLAEHGSSTCNAFTSATQTVYYMDVASSGLAGAVERLVNSLGAPLLEESTALKEAAIIQSELMQYRHDDRWRVHRSITQQANPLHPISRFSVGSVAKLKAAGAAAVKDFWEKNYSGDRMAVVLASPHSLEAMANIIDKFASIPKREPSPALAADQQPWRAGKDIPAKLRLVPVSSVSSLGMRWVVPAAEPLWKSQPHAMVASLLCSERRGSLCALLKGEGLVVDLTVDRDSDISGTCLLALDATLTEKGDREYERVVDLINGFLDALRTSGGVPDWWVEERAAIARLSFNVEPFESLEELALVASRLRSLPIESALEGVASVKKADVAEVVKVLNHLTPDKSIIVHSSHRNSKELPSMKSRKCNDFDFAYGVESKGGSPRNIKLDFKDEMLVRPQFQQNSFVPDTIPVCNDALDEYSETLRPSLILQNANYKLFHAGVNFFRPQTALFMRLRADKPEPSRALTNLLLDTQWESKAEEFSTAREALLQVDRTELNESSATTISFCGWTGGLEMLVKHALNERELSKATFHRVRERKLNCLRETMMHPRLSNHCRSLLMEVLTPEAIPLEEEFEAVNNAKFDDVQKAAEELSFIKADVLAVGNITAEEAVATSRSVEEALGAKNPDKLKLRKLNRGDRLKRIEMNRNPKEVNSALLITFMMEPWNAVADAKAALLQRFLRNAFFRNLRTRQRIGYTADLRAVPVLGTSTLRCFVQSSVLDANEIQTRADAFVESAIHALTQSLDDPTFERTRVAEIMAQHEPPKNALEYAGNFWPDIEHQTYAMDGPLARQAELAALTRESFVSWATAKLSSSPAISCAVQAQRKPMARIPDSAEKEAQAFGFDFIAEKVPRTPHSWTPVR